MLLPALSVFARVPTISFERFSLEQGLSQGTVLGIEQDKRGFIWLATYDGLNRFDGHNFKQYRHDSDDPASISGNSVSVLFVDSEGIIWIGTDEAGLNRYDPNTDTFTHFVHDPKDPGSISENFISAIAQDGQGRIWVATRKTGLNLFNPKTQRFTRFLHQASDPNSLSGNEINKMISDRQGRIWITTQNSGLNRYDPGQGGFVTYQHDPNDSNSLSSNELYGLYADSADNLWVGSDTGLNRLNLENGEYKRYLHKKDDPTSINDNLVWTITEDVDNNIWVGTDNGLSRLDSKTDRFLRLYSNNHDSSSLSHNIILTSFRDSNDVLWFGTAGGVNKLDLTTWQFGHYKSTPQSLSHNMVMSIYQDPEQNLWIGTDGGGLNRLDGKTGEYTTIKHNALDPTSIGNDRIWSIEPAKDGQLWLGVFGKGVERFDPVSGTVTKRFSTDKNDEKTVSGDFVYKVYVDRQEQLWIGSGEGGVSRYNKDTNDFTRFSYDPNNPNSLSSNQVFGIHQDRTGRYWIATDSGLDSFFGKTNHFVHYRKDKHNSRSISRNFVISILESLDGTLWFGTVGGGLNKYNADSDDFTVYSIKQGLPNEVVYGILEDDQGYLWLSTNKGIARFDPKLETFRNFDKFDGLQSNEFNGNAYHKGVTGELFFGGVNGFNRFFPDKIKSNVEPPPVILTDFFLFNQTVPVGSAGDTGFSLKGPIEVLKHLTLSHKESLVTFEFAALAFIDPSKIQYQYKLEGFDDKWLNSESKFRRASYTNLPPGDYTMKVRAAKNQGQWSQQQAQLKLTVLPPLWRSDLAYVIYTLLFVSSIFGFIHVRIKSNKMRNEIKLVSQLKQLDKLKDTFLANTSHELRTPLNGIIGLAESLLDGNAGKLPPKANQDLAMVVTSGKRLANLVNDILDLSKLKDHSIVLHRQPIDLRPLVDTVLSLSKPMAKGKGLALNNNIDKDLATVYADEDRLLQILHNLVGNAVKFTEKGAVTVEADRQYDEVQISIKDTGIGIPKDKIDSIFESFEQVDGDDRRMHGGTGLGLAISKQLVELHDSRINVDSTPGVGSKFSFTLSVSGEEAVNHAHMAETLMLEQIAEQENIVVESAIDGSRFRILIADDEPINLKVLQNHLSQHDYQIVQAQDGAAALELLETQGPFDMVLLDVMMPNMSGIEVCIKIREKWSMSELPVLFLTAKNQMQDVVEGFAAGANDHIAKPVSKQELLSRVATHLQLLDINRDLDKLVDERTEQVSKTQQKLVLSEKLANLGTLMAGVAHEINNPTNFVHVSVQNLEVDLAKCKQFIFDLAAEDADQEILDSFSRQFKPLEEHLVTIKDGTQRIKDIVKDLKTATHLEESDKKTVGICDILTSTMNLFSTQYKQKIELVSDFRDHPEIACYPSKLNQVLMNLLVNAGDAILEQGESSTQGRIEVGCKTVNDKVLITVSDNGQGMAQETKEKLFEPFYTTKDIDHGTGLGLSISYDIVQKHNGDILVYSKLGEGTTFTLVLPLSN